MRLLKYFLIILWILATTTLQAQDNARYQQLNETIYKAFITGDIPLWQKTLREMDSHYYRNQPEPGRLYELLLARYGYIAMCLAEDNKAEARSHLDKAENELTELLKHTSYQSQAYALQGAFLGFRISLRPMSAILLGPRSYKAIDRALELNPKNPTAWMEKGNSRFYTPSTFGGSKQEALDSYKKAVGLFEANPIPHHRWLYLNSLVGMARSYEYLDQQWLAVATYESALRYEPGFTWVKNELLPQAREKLK